MDFTISNHPTLTGITRTVSLIAMSVDTVNKTVVLNLKINHFLDGIHIKELVKDIVSTADNNLLIVIGAPPEPTTGYTTNELGETVIETITHPAPTVGEFDYWMVAYENHTPLDAMLQGGITNIDNNGLINSKANYSA
jgi:hypothetical protein